MKISKKEFDTAVTETTIPAADAEALWVALQKKSSESPKFDLPHLAYYFGALIVISAMGWFITRAWELFGGGGIFLVATTYAVLFALAGRTLWFEQRLKVPGGLLFTLSVWMTPLAVYGLERLTGLWPDGEPGIFRDYHVWVKGSWVVMELATILAALVALRFIRFPFLTFPLAFSLWYMSMDLTPLLFGQMEFGWKERLWVSLVFGLAMLCATYLIDRRTREDYAFWCYLFGLMAFWGGLSLMESSSELNKFLYCLINVGLMALSILLQRRIFLVFGSLGVFGYLGYLSYRVFQDSILFPFVLTAFGLAVIYLGVKYQRHRDAIENFVLTRLPLAVKELLPNTRA